MFNASLFEAELKSHNVDFWPDGQIFHKKKMQGSTQLPNAGYLLFSASSVHNMNSLLTTPTVTRICYILQFNHILPKRLVVMRGRLK